MERAKGAKSVRPGSGIGNGSRLDGAREAFVPPASNLTAAEAGGAGFGSCLQETFGA